MLERVCRKATPCDSWWECKLVQSLRRTAWRFLKKLKIELPYDLATSCEESTHWKRLWCWEGLGAGGEGDDREWDGWMASPTRWAWAWVNSGSWWWTGRPGVLCFMGLKESDMTDWTEVNYTDWAFLYWDLYIRLLYSFICVYCLVSF